MTVMLLVALIGGFALALVVVRALAAWRAPTEAEAQRHLLGLVVTIMTAVPLLLAMVAIELAGMAELTWVTLAAIAVVLPWTAGVVWWHDRRLDALDDIRMGR